MPNYPLTRFHFSVNWGGANVGFSEVTGLDFTTEVTEYRHGAMPEHSKVKLPGLRSFTNITLKRGTLAGDNQFYEWWNSTLMDKPQRRDVTISLLNEQHNPIIVWRVKNAWPVNVKATDLNADDSGIAVESMELTHEGLTMEHVQ
jgi:phage tail-like protein